MRVPSIIERVLTSEVFISQPPVILDLGAAGDDRRWSDIAGFSSLIAIDADVRDFGSQTKRSTQWHRRLLFNECVASESLPEINFYLTADPHCSSTLPPMTQDLDPWIFSRNFETVKVVSMPAVTPTELLARAGVSYVDWIKFDTQGTDLRLLRNLPEDVWRGAGVIQMEPGILSAYQGEDKLHHVLQHFDAEDFFLSSLDSRGTQRVSAEEWGKLNAIIRRWPDQSLRPTAGWAEVTFVRAFLDRAGYSERELMWGWVVSMLLGQWGHAIYVSQLARRHYENSLFSVLEEEARRALAKTTKPALREAARRVTRRVLGRSAP
mgnify:CR=1 FL=1